MSGRSKSVSNDQHRLHSPREAAAIGAKIAYRPPEAAAALGLSRSHLFQLLASGDIRSTRVGGIRLIPREALEEWLSAQMEAPHA
jgi:excisionase family DNA binding protein